MATDYESSKRRSLGILRDQRICTICSIGEIGEEIHYLLNGSDGNVKGNRTKSADKYYTHHPNVPKFCSLVSMTLSLRLLIKLARFINCIF